MKQIHKKFNSQQVREFFNKYENDELKRADIQETLGIAKTRFFEVIKEYRQSPQDYDIKYKRKGQSKLTPETENSVREELIKEQALIDNNDIPIYRYNYASISRKLLKNGIEVSAPTVRERAKK